MNLPPTPIPSDASKAPIIPGISLEMFDLLALLALVSPGFFFLSGKHPNPFLAAITALPGAILSIWLVWKPPKDGQRGWQRLLARIVYQFMSTKQYRTRWVDVNDELLEVKLVGKKDRRS